MVCPLESPNVSPEALYDFNQRYPKLIWHNINFSNNPLALWQNHKAFLALQRLLTEVKPELMHCHGTVAGKYGRMAAKEQSIPVFYTAHDFRIYRGCTLIERLYFSHMERKLSKNTNCLFPVCEEDATYAKTHLHAKKVVSISNMGLDCAYYAASQRNRLEIRQELRIPENAVVLISVGNLQMHKRLRVVLQAMTRLRDYKELYYVICGDGTDMLFLKKLTEKLHIADHVRLVGYRTDIPDLLGASDIFCMPSRREGSGVAALEAMSAGLPLIAIRVHGTKTFVTPESAICLKGDLIAACADAIEQLYHNRLLRRQMGAHNRAAANSFSDKDRMMLMREQYCMFLENKEHI